MDRKTDERLFSARPSAEESRLAIPLYRIKGNAPFTVICCATDVVGRWVHYDNKRTRPCLREECPQCLRCRPKSFMGWFPALSVKTGARGYVQLPLSGIQCFDKQLEKCGTAFGYECEVKRVGDPVCGTVHVRFGKPMPPAWKAPDFPSTIDYLYRLWGIGFLDGVNNKDTRRGDIEDFQKQLQPPTEVDTISISSAVDEVTRQRQSIA